MSDKGGDCLAQKRLKKTRKVKSPFDRHHLFWIRKEWNKGELNKLRLHPYCIVPLDRVTIHRYLHVHLACIPTPNGRIVGEILDQLKMLENYGAISQDDSIEKRLKVLIALFECVEQPTADALKEQLRLVYEFKKSPS